MPPSLREAGKPCSVTRVAHRALFTTTKTPNLWFDNSIQPSAILDQLAFFLFPFFWQYSKFFIVDVTSGDVLLHELMKYVDHVALRKNDFGNSFKMCRKKGGVGGGEGAGLGLSSVSLYLCPPPSVLLQNKMIYVPLQLCCPLNSGRRVTFFSCSFLFRNKPFEKYLFHLSEWAESPGSLALVSIVFFLASLLFKTFPFWFFIYFNHRFVFIVLTIEVLTLFGKK